MITSQAAIATTQAIWEWDPQRPGQPYSRRLDVLAAIRTLTVKIQASGQRIAYFHALQTELGLKNTLALILHGNTRWGTAYGMVHRAHKLKKVQRTTYKKIPWTAFKLGAEDWVRVQDCELLLKVRTSSRVWSSSEKPTIWSVIPAYEKLLKQWTTKRKDPRFELYYPAIDAGIAKFEKYYSKFDLKPSYILAMCAYFNSFTRHTNSFPLVIHPFYKLSWFEKHWGGAKEQAQEIADGNPNAKNWQEEARKVVEAAVCSSFCSPITDLT
ncbi:hypothetical protein BDZ89DRAFT_973135 [Hymenopellis radicata]|nr:hypothetical protein BDZ89DRAFT_973135 [Hymenopellis radicata]